MTETNEILADGDDQKELARTMLKEGASIEDVMSETTLTKPAILGLKGALAKANKRLVHASKPAYEPANPTEAETKPESAIQAESEGDVGEGCVNAPIPSSTITPENFISRPALTREEWTRYSKMKVVDLVSEVADLKAQNASLQGLAQSRRGNGHGNNGHEQPLSQREMLSYLQT
jgi:hypothetical protein